MLHKYNTSDKKKLLKYREKSWLRAQGIHHIHTFAQYSKNK